MNPSSSRLLGIGLVLGTTACFALMDTLTQLLAATVSVAMMMWVRYLVQMLTTAATDLPRRGLALLHTRVLGLQLGRGLALALTNVLAVLSLQHIAVGEYTAIVMLTPVGITLVASTALGERVSPLRWLMVAGGFAGALLVVRPGGDDFHWPLLLPVGTMLMSVAFQLLTARLAAHNEPAGTTNFYTAVLGTVLASVALAYSGWQTLSAHTWWLLAVLAIANSAGHLMLVMAYGRASPTEVAPFLYFQIGFAALAGWALLSQVPDGWSLAGIALISVCGVAGSVLKAREARP